MSASRVGIELPNPNFAGTNSSGAMNKSVPPSTIAWADIEWSISRVIIINPKSARQALGGTSLFTRMFDYDESVRPATRGDAAHEHL